jgi:hypothetical protein
VRAQAAPPIVDTTYDSRGGRPSAGLIFIGVLVVFGATGLGLTVYPPLSALALVPPAVLVLNWVWRKPARGFYMLFAATLVFEIFPLRFPDSLTDRVPFFLNLNNTTSSAGLSGIPITPAEILMISVVLIWFAAGVARRTLTLTGGPLVTAYLIFTAIVIAAEIHGILLSKGDWDRSLWELRPQVYGILTFLFAANLITERRQLRLLTVVFFLAIAFKVGIAIYRYVVTLHGNASSYEAIMAHEESYFFALFILGTGAAVVWGRGLNRWLMLLLLAGSALSLYAMLINQRRAAELGLIAGGATMMVLAIRFESQHRGLWLGLSVMTVLAVTIFTVGYWNHTTGLAGQLLRPIHSIFVPDQRDYLSNIYRVAEDANLQVTFRTSPLTGIGFGIPMIVVFPMADISQSYPLWNYIPHNTLLWIGMRMGAIGWAAFFGLVAMAILQATRQLGTRRDPFLNAFAAFAVAAIVAEIIQGYSDIQLDTFRNLIFFGAVLGILNRLPKLADA